MTIGKTYHYGREDGLKGVEADYMLDEDGTLHIKIVGSNHWLDYLTNVLAWPMKTYTPWFCKAVKVHRVWSNQAIELTKEIASDIQCGDSAGNVKAFNIIGHSMGGAVAALLAIQSVSRANARVTLVNAPKCGNKAAMWRLRRNVANLNVLYDKGDIVHWLPLFLYCNYPLRSRRSYGHTRGIGKAHNNMPAEWKDFPI